MNFTKDENYKVDKEILEWIAGYERNKGKKLYRELLSFIMNDTITGLEQLFVFMSNTEIETNLKANIKKRIEDINSSLKDFIVKSIS